jgi:imidazolonepropionase-like amidohydrolase
MFVFTSYELALSNQWRPTDAEQRLADPEILGAMRDLDRIPKDQIPPRVAKLVSEAKPVALRPVILENLKKVWDAGIPVAMGTDAGNIGTLHGPSVFREMELMVKAGLTPLQVLRASTVNGARVMGMEKTLGIIHPRMLADLVILDADPLVDINNASRVSAVFKDGREVSRDLSPPSSSRQ